MLRSVFAYIPSYGTFVFGVKICTFVSSIIFIYEHLARKQNIRYRPSTFFNFIAVYSIKFWNKLGKLFAIMSSFLTAIDIDELYKTYNDIVVPIVYTISSPMYFIYGYIEKCNSYVRREWLVPLGSAFILLCAIYVCYRYAPINMISYSGLRQLIKMNN